MKLRSLLCLPVALAVLSGAAAAEPLTLLEDYAGDTVILYNEDDPAAGQYEYTYRFPRVEENVDGADLINSYYEYSVKDLEDFTIPINASYYKDQGISSRTDVTYTVTCNSDEYFSILISTKETVSSLGFESESFSGNVFSRKEVKANATCSLAQLIGKLSYSENDEWLQKRQTEMAEKLIREMVWERISGGSDGIKYYPDLRKEDLELIFKPDSAFYLDENGDPVFYLQPGDAAPQSFGLITFPIPLDDILDEL